MQKTLSSDELNISLFSLMQIAPLGICITDEKGYFISVNQAYCEIYDYNEDQLLGKHFTIVTFEEDHSYWFSYYDSFWKDSVLWGEAEVKHRSGKKLFIIARALKVNNHKITFIMDVTTIREAKQIIVNQHHDTLHKVVQAQESERKRISAELHDGLGQMHTLAKLEVNNIEHIIESELIERNENIVKINRKMFDALNQHIGSLRNTFDDMYLELDKIINNLRPLPLTANGLIPALEILCKRISKVSEAQIQFFCDIEGDFPLHPEMELHLYRITQEILSNAVKYAFAKQIFVQLVYEKPTCILSIEDDGVGFDLNQVEEKKRLGLHSIRTRCQLINATMNLDTAPNKGTSYVITFMV